ncbi:unnamed protein product [Brachionus calyciflorus]|uniref:FLYWCH-type domain-containing protein n=1 Tax=Brachionus calyciflorus TaxID=104777 RepID=A0A814DXC1_9BILA|nr:unnamed protein product [Brachionus calyciflorus]
MSQKKKPQLFHIGFFYKLPNPNSNSTKYIWRCRLNNCKATGYTFTDKIGETDVKFYITNEIHIETPDNTRFEKLEHRLFLKERAANSDDKPRKIINLAERPYEDNVLAQLPSNSADRQAIVREQKRNKPQYPKQPEILSEIEVPDWLKMSLKNEDFLFYDSGPSDMDRFLIFGTRQNLKLVEYANIFCDGTFSVAPKLFKYILFMLCLKMKLSQ